MKIGILLGSTREGRVSPQVGEYIKNIATKRDDATFEVVDIKDYKLPLLGESDVVEGITAWNEKLASLDGFIFITAEYNHSLSGSLKNALDLAREPWANKAAAIVSYGSTGGVRAAEHLRAVMGELQIADVRTNVAFNLFTDFENGTVFKPADFHVKSVESMLDQLVTWTKAMKSIR
ncbi:TPA: NAD(P)H-dependent oxidoreductase [bacterium]|nr:NAD(P)H-dependent oxidoreductase [bacterium]